MYQMNRYAFTLVELIVVITILAILGTIGFISLQGYAVSARDSTRLSDIKVLEKGLLVYQTVNNTLPLPDNAISISASGTVIGYQGYVGKNMLAEMRQPGEIVDPTLGTPHTYHVNGVKNQFQLLGYFEKDGYAFNSQNNSLLNSNTANASVSYSDMYVRTFGIEIGVLTQIDNTPIMEVAVPPSDIDIEDTLGNEYKAYLGENKTIQGDESVLFQLHAYKDCKTILELEESYGDGAYSIGVKGDADKIYCDMTTNGGGWTAATMLADQTTKNLFDTGNSNPVTSISADISSKGNLSKLWNDNLNRDIMLQCFTESLDHKGYEIPFIIYSYPKSDIYNLERRDKAPTSGTKPFSSKEMNMSWNGNNIPLHTGYYSSSDETSVQLRTALPYLHSGPEVCFRLNSGYSLIVGNAISYSQNCPAYKATYSSPSQYLDTNNYCISYLR